MLLNQVTGMCHLVFYYYHSLCMTRVFICNEVTIMIPNVRLTIFKETWFSQLLLKIDDRAIGEITYTKDHLVYDWLGPVVCRSGYNRRLYIGFVIVCILSCIFFFLTQWMNMYFEYDFKQVCYYWTLSLLFSLCFQLISSYMRWLDEFKNVGSLVQSKVEVFSYFNSSFSPIYSPMGGRGAGSNLAGQFKPCLK